MAYCMYVMFYVCGTWGQHYAVIAHTHTWAHTSQHLQKNKGVAGGCSYPHKTCAYSYNRKVGGSIPALPTLRAVVVSLGQDALWHW